MVKMINNLTKIVGEQETKLKAMEQKVAYVDSIIDRVNIPQAPIPPVTMSEDRVRAIVESALKTALGNMKLAQNPTVSTPTSSLPPQPVQPSQNPLDAFFDNQNTLNVSELNNILASSSQDDDIIIEERKTEPAPVTAKAGRGGRKTVKKI